MRARHWQGSHGPRGHVSRPRGAAMLTLLALLVWSVGGCAAGSGSQTGATRSVTMLVTPPPITLAAGATPATPLAPLQAVPPAPSTSATALILLNPDTGGIYLTQNADEPLAMASTTKIMTALVAVTYGHLEQRITVGADSAGLVGTGASVAYLKQGQVFTLRELLYALLLPSGDDAAVAIADGVAGSQFGFVLLMNDEARRLGLSHTHFANVHGLDAPDHYSSAADLARLAILALRVPVIASVVDTATEELPATPDHPAFTWTNTNKLLSSLAYPGTVGVKTGYTGNAGYCLVFAAVGPSGRLIGVVLDDTTSDENRRFSDARALLDWGFALEARLIQLRRLNGPQPG